ncbi:hypothetical protein ACFRAI_22250 [Streptomyces sp. NPDC056637]|uniref:hypothetical protein n=1 Tax=unclassified Streptomyces TaxID=2593676 RepID=UPI0036C46F5A
MHLTFTRILLSPVTSCRAGWAVARSEGRLSFDAAWRQERVARHPDELVYRQHGHQSPREAERQHSGGHMPAPKTDPKTEPGPTRET